MRDTSPSASTDSSHGAVPPDPTAPPHRLVRDGGFAFGTYDAPVPELDLLARWSGPARAWHASRLKEWQAFQLTDGEWFVLGAVYDAKLLGLVQLVAVHQASGRVERWEHRVPSTRLSVASGLDASTSVGRSAGLEVTFANDVGSGRLAVTASQSPRLGVSAMSFDVAGSCAPGSVGHLVICHPFPDGTPLYSDKCMMPAEGSLTIAGERLAFAAGETVLVLDDHKGHYPSPMRYDWVTAAGRDGAGRVVGFNLTDNQVRDPDTYNENALWVGADVHRLGAVRFDRPRGVHGPWRVTDRLGMVDVTFEPSVPNEQHVGPRSVLADYYGPFGWCSGRIDTGAASLDVDGMFGMGEQKFIRI